MARKEREQPDAMPALNLPEQFIEDGVVFPGYIRKDLKESIEKFECKDDDVYVVTYPKSGTTWAIEMVSLVLNNANTEYNLSLDQMARVPVLELRVGFVQSVLSSDGVAFLNSIPSPRVIKSHLPRQFFPKKALKKKCKIVYVIRNPKDTIVSYYYFHKNNYYHGYFDGTWSTFFKAYLDKQVPYGDWFDHVLGWWEHSADENICFLKYEEMKKNPRDAVKKLCTFFEKTLSEEETQKILEHCSFQNMKKNPTVNMDTHRLIFDLKKGAFIRKGVVGDWENHFTVAENAAFEELYAKKMKGSGLALEW